MQSAVLAVSHHDGPVVLLGEGFRFIKVHLYRSLSIIKGLPAFVGGDLTAKIMPIISPLAKPPNKALSLQTNQYL